MDFDDDAGFYAGGQGDLIGDYEVDEPGTSHVNDIDIDWSGGTRADFDRTVGGKAFEKKDMYDMSLEGKLMIEIRKVISTYSMTDNKAKKIEDMIKAHDVNLKMSNPPLIVEATVFIERYASKGGLNKTNYNAFSKKGKKKSINDLDLIRYIKFLDGLGM